MVNLFRRYRMISCRECLTLVGMERKLVSGWIMGEDRDKKGSMRVRLRSVRTDGHRMGGWRNFAWTGLRSQCLVARTDIL